MRWAAPPGRAAVLASRLPETLPAAGRQSLRDGYAHMRSNRPCRHKALAALFARFPHLGVWCTAHRVDQRTPPVRASDGQVRIAVRALSARFTCSTHVDVREARYREPVHQLRSSAQWFAPPTKGPERPVPIRLTAPTLDAARTRPEFNSNRDIAGSQPKATTASVRAWLANRVNHQTIS